MFEKLSYVGIAVRDAAAAAEGWCSRFGLVIVNEITSESEGVHSIFVGVPNAGAQSARIELVEPLDADDRSNPVAARLADSGEGVLQLAFTVADPADAAAALGADGVRATVVPPFADGYGERCLVGPRSANGVLLELIRE